MATKIPYESILASQREDVRRFIMDQILESRTVEKEPRRPQNRKNWRYFHGNIDWSHKKKGDARIHLHKLGVAAERHRAKFKQSLMKFDSWVSVELEPGAEPRVLTDRAAKKFTVQAIERAKGKVKLSDSILLGELEARSVLRVGWTQQVVPRFVASGTTLRKKNDTRGQLDIQTRSFEEYHRDADDPRCPLYEAEELLVDYYKVLALASEEPTAKKPYRLDCVKELGPYKNQESDREIVESEGNLTRERPSPKRKMTSIINYFGTILSSTGEILEWQNEDGKKIPLERVLVTIANEEKIIRDPIKVPRWSGKSPFVSTDLLRSPGAGLKALMDAGTDLNEAENELMSMMLTGAYKAVHNATWYREDWIADGKKLSGGIKDGDSIPIDSSAPANAQPMGTLQTGNIPAEAFSMQQILSRSFAENVFSNLLDLSGNLGSKQVRATEINTANQAIGDIFDSLAGDIEEELIEPFLQECFLEIMQNSNDLSDDEILHAFDGNQEAAQSFKKMTPQERFADAAGNFRFLAKGLRGQIANATKGQAMINFLNTMTANPITFEAIRSQVSVPKIAKLVGKGLGLDEEEFSTDERERALIEKSQEIREGALAQAENEQGGQASQANPGSPSQGTAPAPEQPGGPEGF